MDQNRIGVRGQIRIGEYNASSHYELDLQTTGEKAEIDLSRQREFTNASRFGRPEIYTLVSQEYRGKQNIKMKINMNKSIIVPDQDTNPWLECCTIGYEAMYDSLKKREYGLSSNLSSIFDCNCPRPVRAF